MRILLVLTRYLAYSSFFSISPCISLIQPFNQFLNLSVSLGGNTKYSLKLFANFISDSSFLVFSKRPDVFQLKKKFKLHIKRFFKYLNTNIYHIFRQIEHLLNVHPEKYRSRSGRSTRNSTPIDLRSIDCHRSRSVDYL